MKKVTIYTDGSCLRNPGPGGWAALLKYNNTEKEISGGEVDTTNNRMELMAVIKALDIMKESCKIDVYTDSNYVKKGMSEWIHNWKKDNWAKARKIKNLDLWQELDMKCQKHDVKFHWVKAHAGIAENERVDDLARAEAEKLL